MWYVVQVRAGTEENIRLQCEKNIDPSVLNNCFIPYYEEMKRIRGEWTICKKVLFPGYFFVVTDQVGKLFMELKHVIGLSKLVERSIHLSRFQKKRFTLSKALPMRSM